MAQHQTITLARDSNGRVSGTNATNINGATAGTTGQYALINLSGVSVSATINADANITLEHIAEQRHTGNLTIVGSDVEAGLDPGQAIYFDVAAATAGARNFRLGNVTSHHSSQEGVGGTVIFQQLST